MSLDLEHWSSPNGCHEDCPACAAETQLLEEEQKRIADFCAKLIEQGRKQALYDVEENLPEGIITEREFAGHALKCAIVHAIGEHLKWDISRAIALAADILEDVNAHTEAAELRAKL